MGKWLIIPEWENLEKSVELAEKYDAAFEYNDFFDPKVYTDDEEIEKRVSKYLSLGRDTSQDTLHGVFYDVAIDSKDEMIREYSKKLVRRSFDIAKRLGCRGVVLHTGLIAGLKTQKYEASWLANGEAFYREVCAEYPELDLYLENTMEQSPRMIVKIAEKMEDVSNFKICLDYAHAVLTDVSINTWITELKPYIGHIHVNDNDLKADLHQVPGDGKINFVSFLEMKEAELGGLPALIEVTGAEASRRALEFFADEKLSEKYENADDKRVVYEGENYSNETLMDVLDTTLDIAGTQDRTKLLNLILTKSMELTNCDAGTLYVLKDNKLHFKIMRTLSMGVDKGADGEKIGLPPVELKPTNVCAYSALHAKLIDVADVYKDEHFDFSGPRNYDSMTGYHTQSMLAIPLADGENNVIGVMQLINAKDVNGEIIPFKKSDQKLITILAAQAAITLQQAFYIEEIRNLLWSFTSALAESIDLFTPYNGNHTRKVAEYSVALARKINEKHSVGADIDYFDDKRIKQLEMSAFLHDIGKITLPNEVLNKASRLGTNEPIVEGRFTEIELRTKIDFYEGRISEEEKDNNLAKLAEIRDIVASVNNAGFIQDELFDKLCSVLGVVYECNGIKIEYFTENEKKQLQIRKGTLTEEERRIVESHVTATSKILDKVRFSSDFKDVPVFAGQHHELLNGRGYPNKISGSEIPLESRILTVADVCDALLATDRPYKKAKTVEETFKILYIMADKEGSIERRLVEYLEEVLSEI